MVASPHPIDPIDEEIFAILQRDATVQQGLIKSLVTKARIDLADRILEHKFTHTDSEDDSSEEYDMEVVLVEDILAELTKEDSEKDKNGPK